MLAAGTRLGPYEIVAPLGAGGMGEVYKAVDTRLDRLVAIKILPADFTNSDEARSRFEREARAISQLTHPNICTLFDVGQAAGPGPHAPAIHFLVMEYLEGETLAARLTRTGPSGAASAGARGPVPIDQALRFGTEMATALDAAHRRGIVHRDLKPGNVMLVRSRGASAPIVKLLDFGLAKLAPAKIAGSDDTTQSAPVGPADEPALTAQGALMGTLHYMSPEQLEGRDVDARSDVFALGLVLFEMLAGRRAFEAHSDAGRIAAVLSQPAPPLARLADDNTPLTPSLRRALERVVHKCLAKAPDDRWQSAADLAAGLRWIDEDRHRVSSDPDSPTAGPAAAPVARSRTRERLWMAAAVVIAVAALGGAAWWLLQPKPAQERVDFAISPPGKTQFGPCCGILSISPNGRQVAFVTRQEGTGAGAAGTGRLWIRTLDSAMPRTVTGVEGDRASVGSPFWSPDGRTLAFIDGGRLKKIEIAGGPPTTLADDAGGTGAWSTGNDVLFTGKDFRLYRVAASGGPATAVTELDQTRRETGHWWPTFLPDGRRFIFLAISADASKSSLFLSSLDSPGRTHLVDALSSTAYAQGHLFYQRDGTLMAQAFDEKAGQLSGSAVTLIEGIGRNASNGRAVFSVAVNGTLVYRRADVVLSTLAVFDRTGRRIGSIGEPGTYAHPRLSPDGRRLAVAQKTESGSYDVVLFDLDRGVPTRLTFDPGDEYWPVWTPDGSRVIFSSNGNTALHQRPSDGGPDRLLLESAGPKPPNSVSPDGKLLLFHLAAGADASQKIDIWAFPLTGDPKPFPVISTPFNERFAQFSPDGKWIAYDSDDDAGKFQVYVQPFPTTGVRARVSAANGQNPFWSRDGKQIVYATSDFKIMTADVANQMRPGVPKELFTQRRTVLGYYTVDGALERFIMPVATEDTAAEPIHVVVNFVAGMKK